MCEDRKKKLGVGGMSLAVVVHGPDLSFQQF